MLSVYLLGDFRIRLDDTPVTDVDTPRLQSLLAYLLLHRDAPQSRAHLAFLFWPETTEAQARANLRNLLHQLRRALPRADSYLYANMQVLQWRPDAPLTLDVADFHAALADAERAPTTSGSAAAREALARAAALYRGDLLPSCYDDWIIPEREALRQSYLGAQERLVNLLEEQREYPSAIREAQRLLRYDPLDEATDLRLIRLHALDGDRAGALRVFHTCTTVLQRELEVEPSAATRQAYERLLGAGTWPSPAPPPTSVFIPLIGREYEWAQLLRSWRAVAAGAGPRAVMLRGEAGIGKTRLGEELLQWTARQGIAVANARCYAAEGQVAYAPVIACLRTRPLAPLEDAWLLEVARLLPEVLARRPDLAQPRALTEAWQRERLFEALSRAILGVGQPLLLAIDDLQWCDRDTVEWLHFLLRFDRNARLLVAGAYRPEDIGAGHPLMALLQALRLEGRVAEIDLGPLSETAASALAARIAGADLDADAAQRLYRETEGVPLFVVETVRAGLAAHDPGSDTDWSGQTPRESPENDMELPPKVRSVLEARLAQLSPSALELAGLAATIGREFSFTLLAMAGGGDADTLVRELDELWQRRIVRERGADAYDFSHDKLREVAYHSMSGARRRLHHLQIANALETLHVAHLDPVSHQVAVHCERAGLGARAVPHYLAAARQARRVYANDEAMRLLRRGLALAEDEGPDGGGAALGPAVAVQLWEALGDLLEFGAQHDEAQAAFRNALARVDPGDHVGRARLHRKEGAAMREKRHYAEALDACRRAEAALGERPATESGDWRAEWLEVQVERVWAHYWLAHWPEMAELVDRCRPVMQACGTPAGRARFLMASCLMQLRRDRYAVSDELLAQTRESHRAAEEWGDLKCRMDTRFELGFLHVWRRELDEAEEHLGAALQLADACGAAWLRTLSQTYLTVLHRFRGDQDGVASHASRAEEAAHAAAMPDYIAAARANRAWLAWCRGDLAAAGQLCQKALEQWRQSPLVYPFQWQALWLLIAMALAQGRDDEAWVHAQALLEPTQQRLPDALNEALEGALLARAAGQATGAHAKLDRAVATARNMGYL